LNLVTKRLRIYHVSALRAFNTPPEDADLTKYAVRDYGYFIVRSVKGFRPKSYKKEDSRKILEFQIEWDLDGSITWEPWSATRKILEVRKWVLSPNCTNKALKALFPINQLEEELESDQENEKEEELKEDFPYWPNLDKK
jgi:hypothetical protein